MTSVSQPDDKTVQQANTESPQSTRTAFKTRFERVIRHRLPQMHDILYLLGSNNTRRRSILRKHRKQPIKAMDAHSDD